MRILWFSELPLFSILILINIMVEVGLHLWSKSLKQKETFS